MPLGALPVASIPEQPGVLQVRAPELLAYPRGKSAMVLYAATPAGTTLRAFVATGAGGRLERARAAGGALVRFATAADPGLALELLVRRFVERFGAPPVADAPAPVPSDPI